MTRAYPKLIKNAALSLQCDNQSGNKTEKSEVSLSHHKRQTVTLAIKVPINVEWNEFCGCFKKNEVSF